MPGAATTHVPAISGLQSRKSKPPPGLRRLTKQTGIHARSIVRRGGDRTRVWASGCAFRNIFSPRDGTAFLIMVFLCCYCCGCGGTHRHSHQTQGDHDMCHATDPLGHSTHTRHQSRTHSTGQLRVLCVTQHSSAYEGHQQRPVCQSEQCSRTCARMHTHTHTPLIH